MALAGTLLHNINAADAAHTPIGLLVALALTGSLALALRLLRESRGALYLMALTFAATLYWIAKITPEGVVTIANNSNGDWWVYGSLAICAVVMIFPQLSPGRWRKRASSHR
jgi:N-acetyl-1-D-myo-inositol-2-amino-2-deoxy-alpha-D-glucopyranoside deacetylase